MTLRRLKWILGCSSAVMVASSVTIIVITLQGTSRSDHAATPNFLTATPAPARSIADAMPPVAEFMPLWTLDLRRPLYDPPPLPPPKVEKPKPPPIAFKLAGVVVDAGGSQAMVVLPDGEIVMLKVEQSIGSTTILEIHEEEIVVLHFGEKQTLKMEGM